jgi:chemotaxis protein CheX
MNVQFVEPFVKAAFTVLEEMVQDRPERGALSMRAATFTTQQVTIMAGVNGDAEGTVLYGMTLVTAQKVACAMMGQPIKEMDDMAWSAIAELGNIITGNAVQIISEAGHKCDITPPTIFRGINVEISTRVPALVVPMTTKFGRIQIDVALTDSVASSAVTKAA